MTKDIKRKNFRFKSDRQRGMVFSFIRELKQKDLMKKEIAEIVKKQFKITAHTRTIEGWIKNQSCRFSENFLKEQNLMKKWREEYKDPKVFLNPNEVQLEEMYSKAHSRGITL